MKQHTISGREVLVVEEYWISIELGGIKNVYSVSNLGRLRRKETVLYNPDGSVYRRVKAIVYSIGGKKNAYLTPRLSYNGKKFNIVMHQIIAKAFIPNPDNKPQVNHINGLKYDNRVENLEWATPGENVRHALRTGLSIVKKGDQSFNYGKNGLKNGNAHPIINIKTGEIVSSDQAAAILNISAECVRRRLIGRVENNTDFRLLNAQNSLAHLLRI